MGIYTPLDLTLMECMNKEQVLEKMLFMMSEMEDILQDNQKLQHLNQKLLERVKSGGYFGLDEYQIMVDMMVKNEMNYEEELYFYRKMNRLKGGFNHECFF